MSLASWLSGDSPKPSSKRKIDLDSDSPAKRKFSKELNQNSFDWYVQDATGKWHCSVCRECKLDNAYAQGHEKPAKTTNHHRHSVSQGHLTAVTRTKLKAQQPMQKLVASKLSKDDETIKQYLKCAYHIGKRELPKEEMKHHVEFAKSMGAEFREVNNCSYTSNGCVTEFQHAIAQVILEDKVDQIKKSGVFSIVIDESTDRANHKNVIMYAQSVNEHGLNYSLLSNKQLESGSGNAKNLVVMIVDELKNKGLYISHMVEIGTDGASVMTGRKAGVVVKLKEYSLPLVGVHCAAHRTALAISQAAKHVTEMDSYSRTVSNVFKYFAYSSLRSNRLREIQAVLNLPTLKFTEVHSVRWLSMESAVRAIYRTYPALCMCLERDAVTDSLAKGLYKEVSQYKFVALTHLMMDVLPFIGRLSKNFQSRVLDFSRVVPLVQSTCESLKDLIKREGVFVEKLNEFVQENDDKVLYMRPAKESNCKNVAESIQSNIEFEGFTDCATEQTQVEGYSPELKYYQQQKNLIGRVTTEYVNKIVENLENRFQDTSIVDSMKVLVPGLIAAAKSLAKYGVVEFKALVQQYSSIVEDDIDTCVSEFQQYKRLVVGSYKDLELVDIMSEINRKYSDMLPNVLILLKCCAVLPMTSVQCERGFSTQNMVV